MKLRIFLVIAAFIPLLAEAGESLFFKSVGSTCSGGQQERANSWAIRQLNGLNQEKNPTIEAFCSELRATTNPVDSQCYANCESQYREHFDQVKEAKREVEVKKIASRQEEERQAVAQQQADAARVAALKAGQVKPANLKEAAIVYNAEHGGSLASAPKIKPDGAMYYMNGKIQQASETPSFLASLSPSEENELLASALRRSRGMGESTDYFAVVVPKQLQKYYFDNAKIGGGFDLIGRYTSNTKYKTVSGREMQAPVFEAVYLDLWSKRQPQAQAALQKTAATAASTYEKCIDDAAGAMPDMIECSNKESARQDARLNAAYKTAMAATADKDGLRSRQRQWIKERDQECALDKDGGQAAMLTSYDCVATKTANRAAELEAIR